MADDTPDPAASALDEIRGRGYRKGTAPGLRAGQLADHAADDIPRLLKAVEVALELADEAEPVERDYGGEPIWWSLSPAELRAAITAALAGKGAGDEH